MVARNSNTRRCKHGRTFRDRIVGGYWQGQLVEMGKGTSNVEGSSLGLRKSNISIVAMASRLIEYTNVPPNYLSDSTACTTQYRRHILAGSLRQGLRRAAYCQITLCNHAGANKQTGPLVSIQK